MSKDKVKAVIKSKVVQEWEDLKLYNEYLGSKNSLTIRSRARWSVLDDLWNELYPGEDYLENEDK